MMPGSRITFLFLLSISQFLFSAISSTCIAQNKISGTYGDIRFSNASLNLSEDSTFTYSRKWHMGGDKSNGHYLIKGDSIFLKFRPLRVDTGYIEGKPTIIFNSEALGAIDRPDTLVYKKDKLYRIENGRIINKTERQQANFIKTKGWRKWYRKKYYLFGPYISRKRNIYYVKKIK